ncbi:flagellar brake protein [Sporomusa acidovorans]|uniref:flagellar brake protein n=1 Tax=Sporomusa acidovorans TaxID=112900 RepID=UPI002481A62A|nr:PilZ domain-containing protein [Sporomusa acidovorans]
MNQRIAIIVPERGGLAQQYHSRVEDITIDHMVIAMPMSKAFPVLLQRGEVFFGRTVINGLAYEFTSSLLAKQMNPLPVWVIALPYNIKKIQQRAFVRIDAVLPVQFKEIINDEVLDETVSAFTKDISGGGVQMVTERRWPIGTRMLVTIDYPDIGPLTIKSEVVRVHQPQSELTVFWIGIRFAEINEKDRNTIIRFIFKKQLEQRRKGLE